MGDVRNGRMDALVLREHRGRLQYGTCCLLSSNLKCIKFIKKYSAF